MNGWVWNFGGMVLTGENCSSGRETLYSVGGRWMIEYGALVEWSWQGKAEVLGERHYIAWVVGEWMGMGHRWNGTDRGKLKYWEFNLSQCHCVLVRSDPEWRGLRCFVGTTRYILMSRYRCGLQGYNLSSSYTKNHDGHFLNVVVTRPIQTNYEGCPLSIQPFWISR